MQRIRRWREICPELVIRSTFIVGFPGETEEDFAILLDFLREAELDRVGCFTYSAVEGATANALPNPVPEAVKEDRKARFMAVQAEISAKKLAAQIGKTLTVIVDELDEEGAVCRSYADAPEIDGVVFVANSTGLKEGDFIQVQVVDSDDYDLWAERIL